MLARYKLLYLAGHQTSGPELQALWRQMTTTQRQEMTEWLRARSIPDLIEAQHFSSAKQRSWN